MINQKELTRQCSLHEVPAPLLNIQHKSKDEFDYNKDRNLDHVESENRNEKCGFSFNQIGGGICVLICIIDWVCMSEFIPLLQSNYTKPYFLRYCVGSSYSIMIIVWFLLNKCKCSVHISFDMIVRMFALSLLYNLPAYSWYLSLNATIAAINNTIYQSSICVAYIFSVLLLPNYSMSWIKNLSVLFCMFGVGLIGFGTDKQSDKEQKNTWYGILECLISTFGFGLLEVMIAIWGKKYFENSDNKSKLENVNSKLLMQGIMGILCFLTLWPGMFVLDWTQIEVFELPKTQTDMLSIVLPSIMDTVYAGAFIIGISLTNPVFMAVCQLLVIPITFLYDVIFNGLKITYMGVLGTLFILVGFLLMELPLAKYFNSIKQKREAIHDEQYSRLSVN
eukprot:415464_1